MVGLCGIRKGVVRSHLGLPGGLQVGHPSRENHARQSAHGHARDMPSLREKFVVSEAVGGVEAKALVEVFHI